MNIKWHASPLHLVDHRAIVGMVDCRSACACAHPQQWSPSAWYHGQDVYEVLARPHKLLAPARTESRWADLLLGWLVFKCNYEQFSYLPVCASTCQIPLRLDAKSLEPSSRQAALTGPNSDGLYSCTVPVENDCGANVLAPADGLRRGCVKDSM